MPEHSLSRETVLPRVLEHLQLEHLFGWAVLSNELIVLEVSERFREFQWDPSLESVGRHIGELLWELVGAEAGLFEVLTGKEKVFRLENVNRQAANGSTIYLCIKAIPLFEAVPGRGLLIIVQDTTPTSRLEQELVQDRNELRLARIRLAQANEELQKLSSLKSLFLSIAAHDMRAPLTAIRGYTELATNTLSEKTDPELADYVSTILSLVDSLNRLVADFLDLDMIEQGNLKIWRVSCKLNTVVLKVTEGMSTVARRKDILLETKLEDPLPAIYADPDRMEQILFNLLSNAIKYTEPGDDVLIRTDSGKDCAVLTVTDHGPGIPDSEVPLLFDLYHRTEDARKSRTKGLGLGLYIVKSLVDLHQGQISVRSEPGKGTEFSIRIPLYREGGSE